MLKIISLFCMIQSLPPSDSGYKTEKEVLSVMRKEYISALAGSPEAASKIQLELFKNLNPRNNKPHPGFYWIKIAAENGSSADQHLLAQVLWDRRKKGLSYRLRAKFWAKKASENNSFRETALQLLKSFAEDEKNEKSINQGDPAKHMRIGDENSSREY
jgi:hypothetical protein